MSDVRAIAHNTIIQLIGKALTLAVALVGFGLMTRYLGQAGYGAYATVYAFLAIFGILVDLGLQMTTTQMIADPAEDETRVLSSALTIRLVSAGLFLGLAPIVALALPYPPLIKLGIAVGASGFIFSALAGTITSFFQKNLIMHRLVAAEIVAKITALVVMIMAIKAGTGLLGVIGATVIDSALTFALLAMVVRRRIPIQLAYDQKMWKKIWRRTWPIAITIALNLIYFRGDIFIMSLMRSEAEVGLYGAPYRVLEVLINIVYLFLGLVLPLLAASIHNHKKLAEIIQAAFDAVIIMAVPLVAGGLIIGQPLMILVAGNDFAISGQLIKILLLATAIIFIASLFGYAIVALQRQRQMIKYFAFTAAFSIVAYTLAIYYYSYWGAAVITVVTELIILLASARVLKQALGSLPSLTVLPRVILAAGAMAALLFILPPIHALASIALGGTIYFVILYAIGGIDRRVIAEIISIQPNGHNN